MDRRFARGGHARERPGMSSSGERGPHAREPRDAEARAYWESVGQIWGVQPPGEPLRPAAEDARFFESTVTARLLNAGGAPTRGVVLGVTRRLVSMRWPDGCRLLVVDWSENMFRQVWPLGLPLHAGFLQADWRQLPIAAGSLDVAVGDGCFSVFGALRDCRLLCEQLVRALRPDGLFVLRCFLRPEQPEPVGALFGELLAGRMANFDLFRWRLAMALSDGAAGRGVRLGDVWAVWRREVPKPQVLSGPYGEAYAGYAVASMARWQDADVCHVFPSLPEVRDVVKGLFDIVTVREPEYELGERFRTLVLRARSS